MNSAEGTEKPDWVKNLEAEPCRCVRCEACGGSGTVYYDIGGRYIGRSRIDDLCEPESCDMCSGGIVDECDRCVALNDYDELQEG